MRYILLLISSVPLTLHAQNFHFAARAGLANYQGDLQAKAVTLKGAKFLGSFGAHYDLTEHITARTYISFKGWKLPQHETVIPKKESKRISRMVTIIIRFLFLLQNK